MNQNLSDIVYLVNLELEKSKPESGNLELGTRNKLMGHGLVMVEMIVDKLVVQPILYTVYCMLYTDSYKLSICSSWHQSESYDYSLTHDSLLHNYLQAPLLLECLQQHNTLLMSLQRLRRTEGLAATMEEFHTG